MFFPVETRNEFFYCTILFTELDIKEMCGYGVLFTMGEKNAEGWRTWRLIRWSEALFNKLKGVSHVAAAMWLSICKTKKKLMKLGRTMKTRSKKHLTELLPHTILLGG